MTDERKEFDLIHRLFAPLAAGRPEALGLLDDAAVLSSPDHHQRVVTTDCLVQGVHFRNDDGPQAVAARALRSNLSDLAAMGATPDCYTLALALPPTCEVPWLEAFVQHLGKDQNAYGIDLVGGDTVTTPGPMTITVTAIGVAPEGSPVRRSTAKNGDDVYVSGSIGDAVLGLTILNGNLKGLSELDADYLKDRFWYPTARTTLGSALSGIASAMADVSDGLLADLGHICTASEVQAIIRVDDIPVSRAAGRVFSESSSSNDLSIITLMTGGDDYELVFTAPPATHGSISELSQSLGVPITRIGFINEAEPSQLDQPVTLLDRHGKTVDMDCAPGYEHQW